MYKYFNSNLGAIYAKEYALFAIGHLPLGDLKKTPHTSV